MAGSLGDSLQRPLDAVEDLLHEAGPQLHAQRLAGAVHRVADRQPRGVLVALRGRVMTYCQTQCRRAAKSTTMVDSRSSQLVTPPDEP